MQHRLDIVSLRAVAVLLVVFYHAGLEPFSGGFVGVDVFFVISGFLMTKIIAGGLLSGDFKLSGFYGGRLRRVFPALCAGLSVFLFLAFISLIYFNMLGEIARLSRYVLIGLANFYFRSRTGYFDLNANQQILLHTWSLSLEMQFYLLYPLALILAYRFLRLKIKHVLWALTAGSFIYSVYLTGYDANSAFYLLPARVWEFTLGGLLAFSDWSPKKQGAKKGLLWCGFFLITAASFLYNNFIDWPFPGLAALPPCLGAVLYLAGGKDIQPGKVLKATLFSKYMLFFGLVSYSLYLWHWPLIVLYKNITHIVVFSWTELVIYLSVALFAAWLSWRYVERPFRGAFFTGRGARAQVAVFLAAGLIVIGEGYCLRALNGVTIFPEQKNYLLAGHVAPAKEWPADVKPLSENQEGLLGDVSKPVSFALIGDSHAESMFYTVSGLARQKSTAGRFIRHNSPFFNTWDSSDRQPDFALDIKPLMSEETYDKIYIIMRWSVRLKGRVAGEILGRRPAEGGSLRYQKEKDGRLYSGEQALRMGLDDTMAYFQAKGVKAVYLILPVPENALFIPQNAAWMSIAHDESAINQKLGVTVAEYMERNKEALSVLRDIASKYSFVKLLDPRPLLTDESKTCFVVLEGGYSLYYDTHHLSLWGADKLAPLFSF